MTQKFYTIKYLCGAVVLLLATGCVSQKDITASSIGCQREDVIIHEGSTPISVTDYWIASCGESHKRYACTPTTGLPLFSAQNAQCAEIISHQ